jgi:cytidylate kinase
MWVNEPRKAAGPGLGSAARARGSAAVVVEVAGPAGAGKTTVARALAERRGDLRVGVPLSRLDLVRGYAPAAAIAPTYLREFRGTRWFTRGESRGIAYLGGWRRRLAHDRAARPAGGAGNIHVFDHGPIYRLVRLAEFGPPVTTSAAFRAWWEASLAQWAATLDLVVWLDASDAVLLGRIRSRERAHAVREAGVADATAFLARYRAGYEAVLARLAAMAGPRLLRFDTEQCTPDRIADQVLAAVEEAGRPGTR